MRVDLADVAQDRLHAGDADRDVGLAFTPGPSERVADDDGHVDATPGEAGADLARTRIAVEWSKTWDKDPAVTEIVLREAKRVVRQQGPILITETHHGFVCANSGVDQSSSGAHGRLVLLPHDPDASARRLRDGLVARGINAAVIVSDTFGRAWREGQTDIAIGVAGIQPILSYIGQFDPHGHEFKVQAICTADELTGAVELVKGNISRVPVGVVRGFVWEADDTATIAPVLRDQSRDLFR